MTANTKKIRINLAALTRVQYTEVIEVPSNTTEKEIQILVDQRYDAVDGGDYTGDTEFWEKGESCGFAYEDIDSKADLKATLDIEYGWQIDF